MCSDTFYKIGTQSRYSSNGDIIWPWARSFSQLNTEPDKFLTCFMKIWSPKKVKEKFKTHPRNGKTHTIMCLICFYIHLKNSARTQKERVDNTDCLWEGRLVAMEQG